MKGMEGNWTVFEGKQARGRRDEPRVTLSPNKVIGMNRHVYTAIGNPKAVEMLYDGQRKRIGLRPCDPQKKNAFEVRMRLKGSRFDVSAGSFLRHFNIKPSRTVMFETPEIEPDGTLALDLMRTTVVTRGTG